MKKKTKIISGALATATLAVAIFAGTHQKTTVQAVQNNQNPQEISISVTSQEAAKLLPMNMSEMDVMAAIHDMSHQKVEADTKWQQMDSIHYSSPMPLTDATVNRLIDVVEHNEDTYQYYEDYLDILHRWQKHDFSQADKDHNAIWADQGGVVGKAYGLATPEEEQVYINEHFNVKNNN